MEQGLVAIHRKVDEGREDRGITYQEHKRETRRSN